MNTLKKPIIGLFAVIIALIFAACEQPTEDLPTPTLTGIMASYNGTAISQSTQLASLKANLNVIAQYSDNSYKTLKPSDYSLTGTLTAGTSAITVTYEGKTATFTVTVIVPQLPGTISINISTGVTPGTELAALTVTYSGSETVSYQWYRNGTAIPGATSSTYMPTEAGSYTVTVSVAGYESKTSAPVVVNDPSLSTLSGDIMHSFNSVVGPGTELAVYYNGSETVSYQWYKNGTPIPGATSSTYTPTEAGIYTVTVSAAGYNPKTSAPIEVSNPTLTGITLNTDSVKKDYRQNDYLDLGNLEVIASYSDGSGAAVTGYTSSPANYENLSTTGTITVTISYTEGNVTKTAAFTVTVSATNQPPVVVTTYTVTFNANSGSGSLPTSQTVNAGSSVTLPSGSGLTRTGYTFGGWNTNASGTGTNYSAGVSYTPTGDITLYAKWNSSASGTPGVEMVFVPGGSFEMGDTTGGGQSNEKPIHTVTLTGFYIGKHEVTQGQYQAVMGTNPTSSYGVGDNYPVYMVSWYDALVFCNKLSMSEGLTPAYRINGSTDPATWGSVPTSGNPTWNAVEIVSGSTGYRLPTEAQWEYAAKGGNGSPGNYTYSGSNTVGNVAWYSSNSGSTTHVVGTKAPNGLGIYDMSGNVYEWCWDWYAGYSSEAQTDPMGASSGSSRVERGGSWSPLAEDVRSAYRSSSPPSMRYNGLGFRLARPDQVNAATVAVTGVTLNKTALTLTVGSSETLTATVSPSDASNKAVSWTSSNTSVASVTGGTVTAGSSGTATITVTTSDGSKTATCTVTVNAAHSSNFVEMVWVPGGSFQMGDTAGGGQSIEKPIHTVTLTGFYIGKYEVTQGQYQAVMGTNPTSSYGVGDNYPVYMVSWYDALVFCNKLSMSEGLTPAYRINGSTDPATWGSVPTSSNPTWNAVEIVSGSTGYRLPTEAQWEYAAKGGNGSPGNYVYAGSNNVGDVAWYSENNSPYGTKPVGTKAPNGLGIYDMSGNVWEWCWDSFGSYSSGAQTDPQGASVVTFRALRGGSWGGSGGSGGSAMFARSAHRAASDPNAVIDYLGFRLARPAQ